MDAFTYKNENQLQMLGMMTSQSCEPICVIVSQQTLTDHFVRLSFIFNTATLHSVLAQCVSLAKAYMGVRAYFHLI